MALLNATYLVVLIVALTVVAVAAANKVITLPAGWAYLALIWPALIPLAILAGLFKDSLKIEKEDDK